MSEDNYDRVKALYEMVIAGDMVPGHNFGWFRLGYEAGSAAATREAEARATHAEQTGTPGPVSSVEPDDMLPEDVREYVIAFAHRHGWDKAAALDLTATLRRL